MSAATIQPPTNPAVAADPEKKTVNVPLLAHVYDHFMQKAKEDDRSLNSYLARLLHRHHANEVAATKSAE